MSGFDYLWIAIAGFGGGLIGTVAGLASLITYPALLAVGLSPVAANVSNTVGLVFAGVGSTLGSRVELVGQRERVMRLAPIAVAGSIGGGILLLTTPAHSFALVVPVLIAFASIAVLVRRNPTRTLDQPTKRASRLLDVGVFAIGVYGGYFGAAAGVLMLALFLFIDAQSLARSNALKNVVLALVNTVASVLFIVFGPVHWLAALPLGAGAYVGGRIGPHIVRHTPAHFIQAVIALAGIGLAVHLALDAYL